MNVLALPGVPRSPSWPRSASLGSRSAGPSRSSALAAVAAAGRDLLETGTYGYWDAIARAGDVRRAFD